MKLEEILKNALGISIATHSEVYTKSNLLKRLKEFAKINQECTFKLDFYYGHFQHCNIEIFGWDDDYVIKVNDKEVNDLVFDRNDPNLFMVQLEQWLIKNINDGEGKSKR